MQDPFVTGVENPTTFLGLVKLAFLPTQVPCTLSQGSQPPQLAEGNVGTELRKKNQKLCGNPE